MAIEQPSINRASSLYSSLTIYALQNIHIVFSDSEHELDASNLSSDDDLHNDSDKSDKNPPITTTLNRDLTCDITLTRSDTNALSQIVRSKASKRKADPGGVNPHNIVTSSLRVSSGSDPSMNDDEPRRKSQRLTRGHGGRTVDYDMKHHPMDIFLRPRYSAKRRDNGKQVSEMSSACDAELTDDTENEASDKKETSPNPHRRQSLRNIHPSDQPIYSAKWHPLDQMSKDNAFSEKRLEDCDRSKANRTSNKSSTLEDEEDLSIITSDFDSNLDAEKASELEVNVTSTNPNQRRSARVSSSKVEAPNYDMKYSGLTQR